MVSAMCVHCEMVKPHSDHALTREGRCTHTGGHALNEAFCFLDAVLRTIARACMGCAENTPAYLSPGSAPRGLSVRDRYSLGDHGETSAKMKRIAATVRILGTINAGEGVKSIVSPVLFTLG